MSRFLFATVPVPAHTRNPLPVAARLVERGHEVLWFAGSRFHEAIAAVGATPVPYGDTRDYDGERLLEEFPELARLRGPRAIGWAYAELFVGEAAHRVADLSAVLAARPGRRRAERRAELRRRAAGGVARHPGGDGRRRPARAGPRPRPRRSGRGCCRCAARCRDCATTRCARRRGGGCSPRRRSTTTGCGRRWVWRRTGATCSRQRSRRCCTCRRAPRRSSTPCRASRRPCTGWVRCAPTRRRPGILRRGGTRCAPPASRWCT